MIKECYSMLSPKELLKKARAEIEAFSTQEPPSRNWYSSAINMANYVRSVISFMIEGLANGSRHPGVVFAELVKQSMESEPVTLNGSFVSVFGQSLIEEATLEYFDALEENLDNSFVASETIVKAALRANIEPDVESVNSRGSYNSIGPIIQRTCRVIARVMNREQLAKVNEQSVRFNADRHNPVSSASVQIIDNVQSIKRNFQPEKNYRIGINRPNSEALASDDEMGLHI